MCGRYSLIAKAEEIEKKFKLESQPSISPRYNAAPTQLLPVITNSAPRGLSFFYWGLIPAWSNNKSLSPKLINARSESLHEKATFKQALASRRCLVPADGFYEWKQLGKKTRIPYRIVLKNSGLFSFAGLWEEYEDDQGEMVHTFTIITTEANSAMKSIHDRMPVILPSQNEKIWLDNNLSTNDLLELLKPLPSEEIQLFTVSHLVNSVQNDSPALVKPAPPTDQKGNYTLFG